MLYISRNRGRFSYCVCDSDDDVEEVVDSNDIAIAVMRHGLEIKGVEMEYEEGRKPQTGAIIPYQLPEYTNPLAVKLKMMYGLNIVVWKDCITRIGWNPDKIDRPVTIELSKFGHLLCDRCFVGEAKADSHKLTFVLDDSVKLSKYSGLGLMSMHTDGDLIFDLSHVMNDDLALEFYSQVMTCGKVERLGFVIDSDWRKGKAVDNYFSTRGLKSKT